jgi:hypothetical protein
MIERLRVKHSSQGKICHVTRGTGYDPRPWEKCTERHHDAEPEACRLVHGVGDIYRDIGSFNSRDLAIEPRSPCVKVPLSRCPGVKANFHRAALVGCPPYGFCAPGRTRTRKYRHRSLTQLSGAFRKACARREVSQFGPTGDRRQIWKESIR